MPGTGHQAPHPATFPDQLRRLRAAGAVTEDTDVVAVHLSHHNPPPVLARRHTQHGARAVPDGTTVAVGAERAVSVPGA